MEKLFARFGKKMSRVGKKLIEIPESVKVHVEGQVISVEGPLGSSSLKLPRELEIVRENSVLRVRKRVESRFANMLWGTYRSHVANMIEGVVKGFRKVLVLVGVGYRVSKQGDGSINLSVGYSHPVIIRAPENINVEVEGNNRIVISGINKEKVGQFAAKIRRIRPPEPYKGKGIRYENEVVKRKAGKAGKVGASK